MNEDNIISLLSSPSGSSTSSTPTKAQQSQSTSSTPTTSQHSQSTSSIPTEAQQKQSTLASITCPVCMDTCRDITVTTCGHVFCHECIMQCLEQLPITPVDKNKHRGNCPVCRKPFTRNDARGPKRSLIPILFKTRKIQKPSSKQNHNRIHKRDHVVAQKLPRKIVHDVDLENDD